MQYLRLHPILEDVRADEELKFERFRFNGGEPHIKIQSAIGTGSVTIETNLKNADYFVELLMATDALRRAGAKKIHLLAPYIPGGRQDRVMVWGEPLSIKVYADIINSQGYERVYTLDPHSPVTSALIDRCCIIPTGPLFDRSVLSKVEDFDEGFDNCVLISPDAGAYKKTLALAQPWTGCNVITAEKIRNIRTGEIEKTTLHIYDSDDIFEQICIIADDICDGGRTFVELGKIIKSHMPAELILYVSHGIFSNGLDGLSEYFDHIITTNCFRLPHETNRWNNFTIMPLRKDDLL